MLWNILDEQNQHCSQAVFFSNWKIMA
ncbi:MEKHLA domain-containing protein [Nostoc sp.]